MVSLDLFGGGRLDSLFVDAGAPVEVTTAGTFDSAQADASVSCGQSDIIRATFLDTARAPLNVVAGDTVSAHFSAYYNTTSGTAGRLTHWFADSSGQPWVAIMPTSTGGTFAVFYNSGTGASPVWTQVGGTFTYSFSTLYTYDFVVTLGSPHTVSLYRGNSIVAGVGGTFTQAALTSLQQFKCTSNQTGGNTVQYSCWYIAKNRSTINAKVRYLRATGASAHGNAAWSGVYTDVNEAINSDATYNSTTTAGNRQTYPMTALSVPAGLLVSSLWQWLRAKNDGASPANILSSVYIGGANYDDTVNMPGIGIGFGPICGRYDTDPSTGLAWAGATNINASEWGFKSAA